MARGEQRGSWLWGSRQGGERKPSRWRLFCSHGSVSEHKPVQLRQLALLCLTSPHPPPLSPPVILPTHTHLSTSSLRTPPSLYSLISYTLAQFLRVCVRVCARNIHVYLNACLTASDDAKHWERRVEAQLHLIRCCCHIGSVRRLHRQAGRQAEAHSRGNDTALLLWERLTEHDGMQRGRGQISFGSSLKSLCCCTWIACRFFGVWISH